MMCGFMQARNTIAQSIEAIMNDRTSATKLVLDAICLAWVRITTNFTSAVVHLDDLYVGGSF